MDNDSEILARGDPAAVTTHAGFPNPAADRHGSPLSLDRLLITHPSSTYFFRIRGHAWEEQGIFDGDIAIIDKALTPQAKDLVVWWQTSGDLYLTNYSHARQQNIWGTVSSVIHPTRKVHLHDE